MLKCFNIFQCEENKNWYSWIRPFHFSLLDLVETSCFHSVQHWDTSVYDFMVPHGSTSSAMVPHASYSPGWTTSPIMWLLWYRAVQSKGKLQCIMGDAFCEEAWFVVENGDMRHSNFAESALSVENSFRQKIPNWLYLRGSIHWGDKDMKEPYHPVTSLI